MEMNFDIKSTEIEDVKIIIPFYREDDRGYFLKDFEKDVYKKFGLEYDLYENFQSLSQKNVIRGLHFQTTNPQIKIVSTIYGCVHDVVVDLRKGSPTFGEYVDVMLSDQNHKRVWIPRGFAHGFEVLSDYAIMSYKCVGKYDIESDSGINLFDKNLNIKWESDDPIISERDSKLMNLSDFVNQYKGLDY